MSTLSSTTWGAHWCWEMMLHRGTSLHANKPRGYLAIQDRMVYDESPNIGGLAPLKYKVCLDNTIRIKKDALRLLA